jgi:chorismate mutase
LKATLQDERIALEEDIAKIKAKNANTLSESHNLEDQVRKLEKQILLWEEKYKKL